MIEDVLSAWILPPNTTAVPLAGGLINDTYAVRCGGTLLGVLQRLNTKIFRPILHEDIEAITTHLAHHGMQTPRLVPTSTGPLWHTGPDGSCWRLLTAVGDRTVHTLTEPSEARSAGRLVARFHRATSDLSHRFRFTRPGAHDTAAHFDTLRMALLMHPNHRLFAPVSQLANELLDAWSDWSGPTELPTRIIHGDLKISNLRFEGPTAIALVDLDTLAHGTIDVELGDAMRSWCNPAGEDVTEARFQLPIFEAAMDGYRSEAALSPTEWASIGPGIERICLELAARFAADALQESYFGFDPHHGGRGEHNLLRARGQAALARSVRAQMPDITAITTT